MLLERKLTDELLTMRTQLDADGKLHSQKQLAGFYAAQMKRIDDRKTERDAESPKTVVDVNPVGTRRGMLLPRE